MINDLKTTQENDMNTNRKQPRERSRSAERQYGSDEDMPVNTDVMETLTTDTPPVEAKVEEAPVEAKVEETLASIAVDASTAIAHQLEASDSDPAEPTLVVSEPVIEKERTPEEIEQELIDKITSMYKTQFDKILTLKDYALNFVSFNSNLHEGIPIGREHAVICLMQVKPTQVSAPSAFGDAAKAAGYYRWACQRLSMRPEAAVGGKGNGLSPEEKKAAAKAKKESEIRQIKERAMAFQEAHRSKSAEAERHGFKINNPVTITEDDKQHMYG
jgi:hypothetical protein